MTGASNAVRVQSKNQPAVSWARIDNTHGEPPGNLSANRSRNVRPDSGNERGPYMVDRAGQKEHPAPGKRHRESVSGGLC